MENFELDRSWCSVLDCINLKVLDKTDYRLNMTNIDVRMEMDDEESSANWTQCMSF